MNRVLLQEIASVDQELVSLENEELAHMSVDLKNQLEEVIFKEKQIQCQKVKVAWVKEGDTARDCILKWQNGRRRRAFIKEMESDAGEIVTDVESIRRSAC